MAQIQNYAGVNAQDVGRKGKSRGAVDRWNKTQRLKQTKTQRKRNAGHGIVAKQNLFGLKDTYCNCIIVNPSLKFYYFSFNDRDILLLA